MNLNTTILNKDNTPVIQSFKEMKMTTDKKGRPREKEVLEKREIILRDIVEKSLLNTHEDDFTDYDLKIKKYELYKRMQDIEVVELNEEEKSLLIRAICQVYEVFFAGQAVSLIK